jgi:hypothetical protein
MKKEEDSPAPSELGARATQMKGAAHLVKPKRGE